MFHKIKNVLPRKNLKLIVFFSEGVTKEYDVSPLLERFENFKVLVDEKIFKKVFVGPGGYGVIWNDELDLSCDELFEKGKIISTVFDNLIAFSEATEIWNLNESTLRKAIQYGKLINGIDACKYGNQWVITREAMFREYGSPDKK